MAVSVRKKQRYAYWHKLSSSRAKRNRYKISFCVKILPENHKNGKKSKKITLLQQKCIESALWPLYYSLFSSLSTKHRRKQAQMKKKKRFLVRVRATYKGATNYYFSYLFTCKPARAFRLLEALLLRLDLPPIHRWKGLGFDWSIITKLTHLFHGFRHFSKPEILDKFCPDPDLTSKTAPFLNCAKSTLCGENWHKNSSTRK